MSTFLFVMGCAATIAGTVYLTFKPAFDTAFAMFAGK